MTRPPETKSQNQGIVRMRNPNPTFPPSYLLPKKKGGRGVSSPVHPLYQHFLTTLVENTALRTMAVCGCCLLRATWWAYFLSFLGKNEVAAAVPELLITLLLMLYQTAVSTSLSLCVALRNINQQNILNLPPNFEGLRCRPIFLADEEQRLNAAFWHELQNPPFIVENISSVPPEIRQLVHASPSEINRPHVDKPHKLLCNKLTIKTNNKNNLTMPEITRIRRIRLAHPYHVHARERKYIKSRKKTIIFKTFFLERRGCLSSPRRELRDYRFSSLFVSFGDRVDKKVRDFVELLGFGLVWVSLLVGEVNVGDRWAFLIWV